jgi:hypothetical protein
MVNSNPNAENKHVYADNFGTTSAQGNIHHAGILFLRWCRILGRVTVRR